MRIFLWVLLLISFTTTAQPKSEISFLARSAGKLPMLSYGLGEDRLGSAKLGYIDTGVLLKIVDSLKDLYVVKLSNNHSAYLSKEFIKADTSLKLKPFYLTNSWIARGDDVYDYLSMNMDEKLPYKSWMEVDPSKIIIEFLSNYTFRLSDSHRRTCPASICTF